MINLDITENVKLINNLSGIELSIADDIGFDDHDYIELIDDKFILYLQIKNMINVILNDEKPKVDINEAKKSVALINAIYQSKGNKVEIN